MVSLQAIGRAVLRATWDSGDVCRVSRRLPYEHATFDTVAILSLTDTYTWRHTLFFFVLDSGSARSLRRRCMSGATRCTRCCEATGAKLTTRCTFKRRYQYQAPASRVRFSVRQCRDGMALWSRNMNADRATGCLADTTARQNPHCFDGRVTDSMVIIAFACGCL